jgi:predicted transport protein
MIITEKNTCPVEKSAILSETKFKIKASAKAFRALSSQIYSNPIAAPLRELAANAWDAHRQANRLDKPFVVHLPNSLEPYVSVRDYGFGMSEEDINTIYTTYFESTKATSNDYIGALGLGSKSPFCYCDSFTVTSYYRTDPNAKIGKKFVYSAYLENGEPSLAKLAEEDTTEPSGMDITFSVKPTDFNDFVNNARSIYSRFKQKPTVTGCADFKLKSQEYAMEGAGWRMFKGDNTNYYHSKTSVAVMGNISYPIDFFSCKTSAQRHLIQCGVELDFEIGELEITLSREALQFDESTVNTILVKLDSVLKDIADIVHNDIKGCKTYWEACCLYSELSGFTSKYNSSFRHIISTLDIKWNDKPLHTEVSIYNKNLGFSTIKHYFYGHAKRRYSGDKKSRSQDRSSVEFKSKIKFVDIDVDEKCESKLRYYIEQNQDVELYAFDFKKATIADSRDKTIELLGIDPTSLITVSSFPFAPRKPRGTGTYNTSKKSVLLLQSDAADYKRRDSWDNVSVEWKNKKQKFYYVTTERNKPMGSISCIDTLVRLIVFAKQHFGFNSSVYGVPVNRDVKIKTMKNWIDFGTYLTKEFNKLAVDKNFNDLYVAHRKRQMIDREMSERFTNLVVRMSKDSDCDHIPFIREYLTIVDESEKFKKLSYELPQDLIEFFDIKYDSATHNDSVEKLVGNAFSEYPLLQIMLEGTQNKWDEYTKEEYEHIKNYIKMVDNGNKIV